MDSSRGYTEPELQKMAAFLRERCERGRYGLTYVDQQKRFIRIPWLTVPRQNEDISENFGMFTEWAYLSFRKRGNRGDQLENEALSAQKHRFRNALARADGIRHVKEMSSDTIRVYEFIDTKKESKSRNSPPYVDPAKTNYPQHHLIMNYTDVSEGVRDWENCSPITVTPSPNQTPVYSHATGPYVMAREMAQAPMQEDNREPSLGTLIEEMINTPEPTLPYQSANGGYTYTIPQPVNMANGVQVTYPVPTNDLAVRGYPTTNQTIRMNGHENQYVLLKVCFRGQEVLQQSITNSRGFRLHSGNNIPDMRRLLGDEQKRQLQMLTKYNCDELYGPEYVDQVEMPAFRECTHRQDVRTSQVLSNMDRGVIFLFVEQQSDAMPYINAGIPNVFAIRLCQTRVFPFGTNVEHRASLEDDGLKRMQWHKIFDGDEFMRDMHKWSTGNGPTPSSSINLSVGQKPRRENLECNLVTLSLSISKAKSLIEKHCEEQMYEICISDKSSMDRAAQQHKDEVQARIQIDDPVVGY